MLSDLTVALVVSERPSLCEDHLDITVFNLQLTVCLLEVS